MAENTTENQESEETGGSSFGEVVQRENTTEDAETEETTSQEESTEETGESEEATSEEGETKTDEITEEEAKLTEKGTKLDPNKLSAAHQQLANEKRVRARMEQVLANPTELAKFMETQYGIKVTVPSKEEPVAPTIKEYKAEDFKNLDDVAKVVNELQNGSLETKKAYEAKITELEGKVSNLLQGGRAQELVTKMSDDVKTLQSNPELDPSSPDFVDGLEERIAKRYHQLDFDETTGSYKGNYSMADIGSDFIEAVRLGKTKGAQKAQTVVKDKSEGKVVTSPKAKAENTQEIENPGDSIAQGVSKLFR